MTRATPLLVGVLASVTCALGCKDRPSEPAPGSVTPQASTSATGATKTNAPAAATKDCDVTIVPGVKVSTLGDDELATPGKPLSIATESGHLYCLEGYNYTSKTTLSEVDYFFREPDCVREPLLGATHVVCDARGIRLTFAGPTLQFSAFDIYPKGTHPFPVNAAASASSGTSETSAPTPKPTKPLPAGCDVGIEPGKSVQHAMDWMMLATPTTPVNEEVEPGKKYCLFGKPLGATSTLDDVKKLAPKTCKTEPFEGGTHLVCPAIGVRLDFYGATSLWRRFGVMTPTP